MVPHLVPQLKFCLIPHLVQHQNRWVPRGSQRKKLCHQVYSFCRKRCNMSERRMLADDVSIGIQETDIQYRWQTEIILGYWPFHPLSGNTSFILSRLLRKSNILTELVHVFIYYLILSLYQTRCSVWRFINIIKIILINKFCETS